eukprot:1630409-Rhodomonas_salina.2
MAVSAGLWCGLESGVVRAAVTQPRSLPVKVAWHRSAFPRVDPSNSDSDIEGCDAVGSTSD